VSKFFLLELTELRFHVPSRGKGPPKILCIKVIGTIRSVDGFSSYTVLPTVIVLLTASASSRPLSHFLRTPWKTQDALRRWP